jgi:hypothetical protein
MTLAMVRYDQSPVRTAAATGYHAAPSPMGSVSAHRLQYQTAGLKLNRLNTVAFSYDASAEEQDVSYRHGRLQLVCKKSGGDGRTGFLGHFGAGNGQFCQLKSGFGKRTRELEQPKCTYLSARFSF